MQPRAGSMTCLTEVDVTGRCGLCRCRNRSCTTGSSEARRIASRRGILHLTARPVLEPWNTPRKCESEGTLLGSLGWVDARHGNF